MSKGDPMKFWKFGRKILSCILAVSLTSLQPLGALAQTPEANDGLLNGSVLQSFSLIAQPPLGKSTVVEGTRFTADQLVDGNLVYFGTTKMNVGEGNGTYEVSLFREGDLDKEASVTIHSLDISALYGKDYSLVGMSKTEHPGDKTILELSMTGESTEEPTPETYEFDENGNLLSKDIASNLSEEGLADPSTKPDADAAKAGEQDEEQGDAELLAASPDSTFANGKSKLAALKEAATGEPTREASSNGVGNSLTNTILEQVLPEKMREIPHSAEQVITFEPGEAEKTVSFRILDDFISEGSETFSLTIADTQGVDPYIATSLSVVISDNEKAVLSKISFDADRYSMKDGKATVGLVREEAVYSLATANITGTDLETGETTLYGTVAFAPYEKEKEVELYPKHAVDLTLTDYTAAQEGAIAAASIAPETKAASLETAALTDAADNDDLTMNVSIGGENYVAHYKKGDLVAKLYDEEHYDIPLEIGQYYFSTSSDKGGIFSYGKSQYHGKKPWGCGTLVDKYQLSANETDYARGYGDLEYYHTSTWATGSVWASNAKAIAGRPVINGLYYRCLVPHWEQTSSFGGGNEVKFKLHQMDANKDIGSETKSGKFGKELSASCSIVVQKICDTIEAIVYAVDDTKWETPKSYMRFYGVAALYKKFRVNVSNPAEMDFKGSASAVPMQVEVKCGAQIMTSGEQEKRDIYANPDQKQSNLVFTVKDNIINGTRGVFGTITGYNITISPSDQDKKVKAEYPKDFLSFLDSKVGESNSAIDYSADTIKGPNGVKERVTSYLDTIPYDIYFIHWIESLQKTTTSEGGSYKAYRQDLNFEPVVAYNDVPVTVLEPDKGKSTCGAKFDDKDLQVASGTKLTYHAGDMLNFAATPDDPAAYRVTGFEISDNGGQTYNAIRDTYNFTLLPNKSYTVRPLLEKNDNHVEILFANDEAKKNLTVENLIPAADLEAIPYLKGKYVLDLNPTEATVEKRMDPAVGSACTVQVLVTGKPSQAGTVYRPVITDRMTGKAFNAQGYNFTLRSNTGDNVIVVGIETVKSTDLQQYSIGGSVFSSLPAIRADGLGKHSNPANGYTVSTENGEVTITDTTTGQQSTHVDAKSSTVGDDGSIDLSGIVAKKGDRISLLIDNGFNDSQVSELVIGDGTKDATTGVVSVNAGQIDIDYPTTAPRIASLTYDYDKASSRERTDLTQNSVRCFDDNLTLSASVDAKGRTVDKLVYTVVTKTGATSTYEAKPVSEGSTLYSVKINGMLDNLHNGDRITVYAVDKEKQKAKLENGSIVESDIVYPTVETGLVAFVENELIAPKQMDVTGAMGDLNVPLIGTAKGAVQSGVMNVSRTDWPDKQGFSFSVNFDMLIHDNSSTPQEKMKAAKDFKDGAIRSSIAKRDAIAAGKTAENAGYSANQLRERVRKGEELTEKEMQQLNDFDRKKSDSEQDKQHYISQAKKQTADLTKEPGKVQVSALFNLDFEFVYDAVRSEYVLATCSVTIGGAFNASKTWYALIGYVPCFFNISGGVEADLTMGGVCAEGKDACSQGDFEGYSGNVTTLLSGSKSNFLIELDIAGLITGAVGAGLCDVLDARGYITGNMQLQLVKDNVSLDNYGVILGASGGVALDLVLLHLKFDIANVQKGWGNYSGRTKVSFFNNVLPISQADIDSLPDAGTLTEAYAPNGEDEISVSKYRPGTSDLSTFGRSETIQGLEAQPTPLDANALLENAADRTRPKLVQLPDGRQFAAFIAAPENGDSACLYYAIREANGTWGSPQPVSDDGTYDSMPDVAVIGNKVIVAWMNASQPIEKINDFKEQFNSFNIYGAIYDAENDVMGNAFDLSSASPEERVNGYLQNESFYNQGPKLSVLDDSFYCTFMTRDLSNCDDVKDLADMAKSYSTMQRARYDLTSNAISHEYVVVRHETQQDPLVIDLTSDTVTMHDADYLLTAYTVDEDANQSTGDRNLYLSICNLTDGKEYWPIKLGSDRCQGVPQLTTLNGTTYLSWEEDGAYLELLDVRVLLESLFYNNEIGDVYKNSDSTQTDWYVRTAADLGLDESTYDGSYYQSIAEGDFRAAEALIKNDPEKGAGIDHYALASDGKDVYVFYTDDGPEITEPTVEVYGRRFKQESGNTLGVDDIEADENGIVADDGNGHHSSREWGFTDGVQVTNLDKVLDGFDLVMDDHGNTNLLSDYFEQWIDDDGKIQFGDNTLMGIRFAPQSSLDIEDVSLTSDNYAVAGEPSVITFDVRNGGLKESSGFTVKAELSGSGVVYEERFDRLLDTNESTTVQIPWTVPTGDLNGKKIKVTVTELGVDNAAPTSAEVELSSAERLRVSANSATIEEDGTIAVTASISNEGNVASEACVVNAYEYANNENGRVMASLDVPGLASGESRDLAFTIDPKIADWNGFGTMELKLAAERNGEELSTSFEDVYSAKPVMLDISNGLQSLDMKAGDTKALTAVGAPWGGLLDNVRFYSSDNSVATVSSDGKVTAVGKGTCKVYAHSTVYGVSDSVDVKVTQKPVEPVKSAVLLAKMKTKGKRSLVLSWNKVNGAQGYDVFFAKNKKKMKKYKTLKGAGKTKTTIKKLKKRTAYRAYVRAWVKKNGKKTYICKSNGVCAITSGGSKRYTNPKKVIVKKQSVSLKKGKTSKIKARVAKRVKGKKLLPKSYGPKLRYVSSNESIATVSKRGKITAKAKGTCLIYVCAINGMRKPVKVTVS